LPAAKFPSSVGQEACTELGILEGITKDSVDIIQTYTGTNDLGLTTEEEITAILQVSFLCSTNPKLIRDYLDDR